MRITPPRLATGIAATVAAVLAGTLLAPVTPPAVAATETPHAAAVVNTCPAVGSSSVRSAPGSGRTVALTFDDGPGPETPKVLAILRQYGVRATFFQVGNNATIWPGYSKQVVAEGHLIGNHSFTHPNFTKITSTAQRSQLDRATNELVKDTGARPCWFRPPGGSLSNSARASAVSRHLRIALWSVDTQDWSAPPTVTAAAKAMILRNAKVGGSQRHPVVLMHDGGGFYRPNMLAELPAIIRYYRDHGYRFVDLNGRSGLKPLPANRIDYRKSPHGHVITFTGGIGTITATGWAVDPDSATPVTIRAQVASKWATKTTVANLSLPAVPQTSTKVDFRLVVPAKKGRRVICVFGVNTGAGATGGIGCATVTVR